MTTRFLLRARPTRLIPFIVTASAATLAFALSACSAPSSREFLATDAGPASDANPGPTSDASGADAFSTGNGEGSADVDGGLDGSRFTAEDAIFIPVSWGNDPHPAVPNGATILIAESAPLCVPGYPTQSPFIEINLASPSGPLAPGTYPIVNTPDLLGSKPLASLFVAELYPSCNLAVDDVAYAGSGTITVTTADATTIEGSFVVSLSKGALTGHFRATTCSSTPGIACYLGR